MNRLLLFILLLITFFSCIKEQPNYPMPETEGGMMIRIPNFKSEYCAPRNIDIWLPENYDSTKTYAVLYMHDGQMLFDAETTWNKQEWKVDETAGKLIRFGIVDPFIVVGIWNAGSDRYMDYFPQKPFEMLPISMQDSLIALEHKSNKSRQAKFGSRADDYLKFIVKELKPFIDERYSTKKEKESTFIAGSSMGGLISWYALCEYPEVFGGAACISTHWPGIFQLEHNPVPQTFANYLAENLPSPKTHKLYFDIGTETLDSLYPPFQKMIDVVMQSSGFPTDQWQSRKFTGENHSELSWSKRLHIPLIFLLSQKNTDFALMKEQDFNTEQTCGYLSLQGDTIIPFGKYIFCFTDTLQDFAVVMDQNNKLKAINILGEEMYEVYQFDNGPDPIIEDRFRIRKDSLIGYANSKGDICVLPQFSCAFPFENGRAKVSFNCRLEVDGEHIVPESEHWTEVDLAGIPIIE